MGFIGGPLENLVWKPGDIAPKPSWGIYYPRGNAYVNGSYRGMGIMETLREGDKVRFKLDYGGDGDQIVRCTKNAGKMNKKCFDRHLNGGDPLPKICYIAVCNHTGINLRLEIGNNDPNP